MALADGKPSGTPMSASAGNSAVLGGMAPAPKASFTNELKSIGWQGFIPVNLYLIQKGLDETVVLYWYQSHGRVIASEYTGKFYMVTTPCV